MSLSKIQTLVDQLGNFCHKHRLTLVTAESCTGGGIAYHLSQSKNCSSILERGYVTYSNQSKESVLKVKTETIQLHGAVSENVAVEMAEGALQHSLAQVSIAITGIAGEDTDSEKDQGIAWIAIAIIDQKTISEKLTFNGSRKNFINYVILQCLQILVKTLKI